MSYIESSLAIKVHQKDLLLLTPSLPHTDLALEIHFQSSKAASVPAPELIKQMKKLSVIRPPYDKSMK